VNPAIGPINLIGGKNANVGAAPLSKTIGQSGQAFTNVAALQSPGIYNLASPYSTTTGYTVAIVTWDNAGQSSQRFLFDGDALIWGGSGSRLFQFYLNGAPNSAKVGFIQFGGSTITTTGTTNVSAGGTQVLMVTNTLDLKARIYVNGILDIVGTANSSLQAGTTSDQVALNHNYAGYSYLAVLWNRGLTAQEAMQFAQNPWQIFAPLQRRIWVGVAAAGGANYFNVMAAGVSNMGGSGAGSKANLGAGVGYMG
jgi:hypothetical protein